MKARFFALAALVLGLASCQNDFDGANVGVGGEVDFQLAVAAPEFGATRADKDGQNGHDSAFGAIDYLSQAEWDEVDLRYTLEVYDYDPATKTIGDAPVKDRMVKVLDEYAPVVFDLRLVPNRHYHFVVFADFVVEGSTETPTVDAQKYIGKHHIIGATLADITLNNDAINNELTDAYFATAQFEIKNSAAKDMILRRPYGKVRVIATDLHELNLNVKAKSVKVEYTTPNANAFNAVTGEISGNGATTFTAIYNNEYTAGYDALTTTALNGTTRYSHMTLSTDYILATDEQTPIHFTVTVYEDENGEQPIKETAFSTDIPVKRNHLTTVIGNVLTTATEINVSIDDDFYGEIKNNMVLVSSADELQEAIDAFENGQVILFDGNINGNVTVLQKEGVNVLIDGNDYKYDGVITVNGNGRSAGQETLTFRNINFETAGSDFTFISAPSKINSKYNYSHNVTVENCTFKGNHTVGCVSFTGTYNFVMRECEADNVHSIAQFQSCDNTVLVEDIEVTNSKSGLSFGNTAYPTLRNASIEAIGYGVRGEGNATRGNLVLENVDIDAYVPVVIRKVTTPGYTVNIDDESTLVAPGYHVVFTKGQDDATFEAPAVEFTVNGADEYNVFPGDKRFAYNRASLQSWLNNTNAGDNVIYFADNIEGDVTVYQKEGHNVVIDGNYYEFAGTITIDGNSRYTDETVLIKNVNFVNDNDEEISFVEMNSTDGAVRYAHNVTIEACTFTGGENSVAAKFRQSHNITIKDCAVVSGHSLAQFYGCENILIEGTTVNADRGVSFGTSTICAVKGSTFTAKSYGLRADGTVATALNLENVTITAEKPVIVRKTNNAYNVNFTGTNELNTTGYQVVFTTGDDEAAFVAPTSAFAVTGADDFKVFPRDAETSGYVYNADELNAALNNPSISTITLQTGEYGTIVAKSNKTIIGTPGAKVDCVHLNGADNLTLKNINFDAANAKVFCHKNGNEVGYANIFTATKDNNPNKGAWGLVIDGCTFSGDFQNNGVAIAFYDQNRITGQSRDITIKNCTFEAINSVYHIYGYYFGGGEMNILNNIFVTETGGKNIYLGKYQSSVPVKVNGNTFMTATSLENAMVLQDHSNYGVSIDASNNTFAN